MRITNLHQLYQPSFEDLLEVIYRIHRHSIFIHPKVFNRLTGTRLSKAPKSRWVVIQLVDTVLKLKAKDIMGPMGIAFKMKHEELLESLMREIDKSKTLVAVLADDALLVHPESFGKVMMKIGKRIKEP